MARPTSKTSSPKPRRQAQDWVVAGLKTLAAGSVADVKVERLAADLGVTKGSFYWHFDDRPALLSAMCRYWVERDTEAIITLVDGRTEPDEPLAAVEQLFRLVFTPGDDLDGIEAGIREWSATDAEVAAVCRAVDERRIAYVADLLVAAGHQPGPARGRAEVLYRIVIGEYVWRRYGGRPLDAAAGLEAVHHLAAPPG